MRARLTLLVVAVAGLLGVLAAVVGVDRVEDDLIGDAIDAAADDQAAFLEEIVLFFDEFGELELGTDPFFDDPEIDEEFFVLDEAEFARAMLAEIDEADALEPLLEAADVDDDESLAVMTNLARVVLISPTGRVEVLEEGLEALGDRRLVTQSTIDELWFAVVEPDLGGVFIEDILDLPSPPDELPELRYAVRDVADVEMVVVADVSDVVRSAAQIRSLVWAITPVLVILAAVVTWLLTGRALRPVHRITSQVGAISGGNLDQRVPEPDTGDEIAELARTMNQMLDRLEADDERLRRFVSDASHELRSPVAVLRSEAEVALREPEGTEVRELAGGVLGEATRLQRVVEDLLVLARGEEHRSVTAFRPVDLDDIVLAEAARRRELPIDIQSVSAGRVRGTPEGCARIVTHLLDNATRHGRTRVWVGLRTEGDTVSLWVDDDGPGVPEADRGRIFERFARLDDARTRDKGGAGLGLAVVAETVAAMGGSIDVTTAPGGGARFVLHWPALSD